jgi:hypothetical protein
MTNIQRAERFHRIDAISADPERFSKQLFGFRRLSIANCVMAIISNM